MQQERPQTTVSEITVSNGTSFSMGFFGGLGSGLATMIFMFVGLLFFIPGLIIVLKQHKLPKEKRSKGLLVTGYILLAIGAIVGMGLGVGVSAGLLAAEV
jgi:hypothetical protein